MLKGFLQDCGIILFFGFLITGVFYASYTLTTLDWVNAHESAHVQINSKFGINSSVSTTYVGGMAVYTGFTGNTSPANLTASQWQEVRDLHLQNEIYGYNSKGIIESIFVVAWIFTLTLSAFLGIPRLEAKT